MNITFVSFTFATFQHHRKEATLCQREGVKKLAERKSQTLDTWLHPTFQVTLLVMQNYISRTCKTNHVQKKRLK